MKYFGTDGIRGTINKFPMTAEIALRVGMAIGAKFIDGNHRHRVVIGKDTRLSGYVIEPALTAGLASVGMDVFLVGPVPTPAVSMLTRSIRADIGIMISASHNPYFDNGIKIFTRDGLKISDQIQEEIEKLIEGDMTPHLAKPEDLGRVQRLEDAKNRYIEFVKSSFPKYQTLNNLKIVVDCANGASYRIAPQIFWELGATVIEVGTNPNGFNINENCGSTHPERAAAAVVEHGAHVGICLDGDADRVILIDETGKVGDGDQFMALMASRWAAEDRLANGALVATVMSNLGLENFLQGKGLRLERTSVGDRYVVERMREGGFNLGGEQSGHIVMTDHATTGDGLMAGLQFLAEMIRSEKTSSELLNNFEPVPQLLKNVRFSAGQVPLEDAQVQGAIAQAEADLAGQGRLLIRKSGTEPLVRVMAEHEDAQLMERAVDSVVDAVTAAVAP